MGIWPISRSIQRTPAWYRCGSWSRSLMNCHKKTGRCLVDVGRRRGRREPRLTTGDLLIFSPVDVTVSPGEHDWPLPTSSSWLHWCQHNNKHGPVNEQRYCTWQTATITTRKPCSRKETARAKAIFSKKVTGLDSLIEVHPMSSVKSIWRSR